MQITMDTADLTEAIGDFVAKRIKGAEVSTALFRAEGGEPSPVNEIVVTLKNGTAAPVKRTRKPKGSATL